MIFYQFFGRLIRLAIALMILLTAFSYIHNSTFDAKVVEIAKKIEGEFSLQFEDVEVKLALNDSTFMLKVEA